MPRTSSKPCRPLLTVTLVSLSGMTALDTCNELPSSIDLLSPQLPPSPSPLRSSPPFLVALYASSLEENLDIEQAELRDCMRVILLKRP